MGMLARSYLPRTHDAALPRMQNRALHALSQASLLCLLFYNPALHTPIPHPAPLAPTSCPLGMSFMMGWLGSRTRILAPVHSENVFSRPAFHGLEAWLQAAGRGHCRPASELPKRSIPAHGLPGKDKRTRGQCLPTPVHPAPAHSPVNTE